MLYYNYYNLKEGKKENDIFTNVYSRAFKLYITLYIASNTNTYTDICCGEGNTNNIGKKKEEGNTNILDVKKYINIFLFMSGFVITFVVLRNTCK
jgi:hypothetical protein